MARLKQLYPGNYFSTAQISPEFTNVIRYLNAAEHGDKTVGELLGQLFDEETGVFDGPIEFRVDSTNGLQWRVGEYEDPSVGWVTLASMEDLRGPPGQDVGLIGQPVFARAALFDAVGGETAVPIVFDAVNDALIVYKNGLLLREGGADDYVKGTDEILLNAALIATDFVVIYTYNNTDLAQLNYTYFEPGAPQSLFVHPLNNDEEVQVYLDGVLLIESVGYILDRANNTIITAVDVEVGQTLTVIDIGSASVSHLAGVMMEAGYADPETGLIYYSRIAVEDDEIPQEKVNALAPTLAGKPTVFVDAVEPFAGVVGDQWLDTSLAPNVMFFYDGVVWIPFSVPEDIPAFSALNARQVLHVNAGGSALEWNDVDLSSTIPLAQKGAASGVATLDGSARIPITQLPESIASYTLWGDYQGAVPDNLYALKRIYKQKLKITGIVTIADTGTSGYTISVNGVDVSQSFTLSTALSELTLANPLIVDSTVNSKRIEVRLNGAQNVTNLQISYSCEVLSA